MKKILLVGILAGMACVVSAAPVTITFQAGYGFGDAPSFYEANGTTPIANNYYAELLIRDSDTAYTSDEFALWTVAGNLAQNSGTASYSLSSVLVGKNFDGTAFGAGEVGFKWQNDTYANYYAVVRFYNGADKNTATYYGTTSAVKMNTPGGSPSTQNIFWSTLPATTQNTFSATFSNPLAVPEPATMALFGLGGLALVIRRKMRKEA